MTSNNPSSVPEFIAKPIYSTYERRLDKEVRAGPIPAHVAIIMDGNRRYAKEYLGNDVDAGHKLGEQKVEELLDWSLDLNIHYITVFAFSSENFKRQDSEIDFIMDMAEASLIKIADNPRIHANRVRVQVLGDLSTLPVNVQKAIDYAKERTGQYCNYVFSICLAYGSRQEITGAVREIAAKVRDGQMKVEDITEETFAQHLYTSDLPDPDLVLRTSGEIRVSNFLLWQLAYSELYFTDIYWPGFRRIDFLRAVRTYQQRVRRYGN
ncbi:MAG: polyprenyl diphosphate synthase [Methanomethylophilus sp.]